MKAERKEEEKWVPIVITLESKEEAQYLYHCLHCSSFHIEKQSDDSVPFPQNNPDDGMFFELNKYREVIK